MKTIALEHPSPELGSLFDQARREDVIVRLEDGSEFMVTAVEEFDREISATRRNEKLMTFLDARARQPGAIPFDEVKRQLGLPTVEESHEDQSPRGN